MILHDKIAAVVRPFVGTTFSTREVQVLVQEKYPGTNPTSIIPSDHSGPNPRSGRSYCNCSGTSSQIFVREAGRYKVLDGTKGVSAVEAPQYEPRTPATTTNRITPFRSPQKAVVIDDAFISEWHPKYDWTESDEEEYQKLVPIVSRELATAGTISKSTFLRIWKWKGAMRVIGHVSIDAYDTLYAPTFRRAASEPSERKLAMLVASGVKLPGRCRVKLNVPCPSQPLKPLLLLRR
jgi:hypothetical protein